MRRDPEAEAEARYQAMLESGEVIQMYHPAKGTRYITNTDHAIDWARKRGYVDVEYEERVVKTAKPVPISERARAAVSKKTSKSKGD